MDQEGGAAAFLLRQGGIDAQKVAFWGSSLFTRAEYDHGHPIVAAPPASNDIHWLSLAGAVVDRLRPGLVVVALNHNFKPPYPRDANGVEISDLWSPRGRAMVVEQTKTFIRILRHDGARVAFVTPPPDGSEHAPTDNAIWAATLPVLQAEHVSVIDIAPAVAGANGGRTERAPDCRGDLVAIRKPREVHYTRYGAGLAATALAQGVAALLHRTLPDATAPGDHAVALVPTATGKGYWIVQCDGSVYHVGDAARVNGVKRTHQPFVAAVAARPRGLWVVARDGTVVPTGGAPTLSFAAPVVGPIVAATGTPDGKGVVEVTAHGAVRSSETRTTTDVPLTHVVAVTNGGAWLVDDAGHGAGGPPGSSPDPPVAAAIAVGNGLLLAGADGSIAARGDASGGCDAKARALPDAVRGVLKATTLPVVTALAAAPNGGYWIMRDNGAVIACNGAANLGGSGNLALFTN